MEAPRPHEDERRRLAALRALGVLDTPPEERFDRVTRLAQHMFGVPIAVVSLVDAERQWFKSVQGLDAKETPREISFCGHAILQDGLFVVQDTTLDQRFSDNPLVEGDPEIRFYAGIPLEAVDGEKLGTLCIIDREPRELTTDERSMLRDLGEMVQRELIALQLATRDELTSLSNRRGFLNIATPAFAICRRLKRPALLLYLDLSGFKAINDEYGHAAGDAALREFAECLSDAFRDSDVVARVGGDEFCVLLTGTDSCAEALARLRERVDARNQDADRLFDLKYSVGSTVLDAERHHSIEDLIQAADKSMYATRRSPS